MNQQAAAAIQNLMVMGFTQQQVQNALQSTNWNQQMALEILLNGGQIPQPQQMQNAQNMQGGGQGGVPPAYGAPQDDINAAI